MRTQREPSELARRWHDRALRDLIDAVARPLEPSADFTEADRGLRRLVRISRGEQPDT